MLAGPLPHFRQLSPPMNERYPETAMTDEAKITPETERLFNKALALHHAGEFRAAAVAYQECTTIAPELDLAWGNMGRCLASLGLHRDAIAAYTKAVSLPPYDVGFLVHAAISFKALGELPEARTTLTKALESDPQHLNALLALGIIETENGDFQRAAERFNQALAACEGDPNGDHFRALVWNGLGVLRRSMRDIPGACDAFQRALASNPESPEALSNYATILVDIGRADEGIDAYKRALLAGGDLTIHSNFLMALLYSDRVSPLAVCSEHKEWGNRLMNHAQKLYSTLPNAPVHAAWSDASGAPRRIRVGYLSADFRSHTTSQFLLPVLSRHTPRIELFLYANFSQGDAITERFRARADHFRLVAHLSDAELGARIRSDQLDILVDCNGHTEGHRLSALALKPAPIICSWVGYPASTGVPTIDYRIVDELTDPAGYEPYCVERLLRLAGGFNCFEPHEELPSVPPLPALLNGYVTFGSANNARKISDETLNMWGEILNALPTSRLRVKAIQFDVPEARQRVQNKLQEVGVAPNRIDFIGFVPGQRQHLSFYNSIDIALDTTPYNGTTTTCDALLMGVPVIALRGNSHLSRVTFSLLERIGLGELAACERAGYINAAVALAAQSERLSSLRSCLRSMVLQSPLCQYTRFVQNLEQEYARLCGV